MPPIPVDISRQNQLVAYARDAISRGEIELGERVCREMVAAGWGDGRTWLLIAEVACRVERADVALASIGRAEKEGAPAAEIAKMRRAAEGCDSGRAAAGGIERAKEQGRVHIIRSWGQGFWSDVDHVIGQLIVAEMTGRTPIVLWGENSRFGEGAGNRWERFFEPVSEGVLTAGRDFFPSKWRESNLMVAENGAFSGPGSRIAFLPFLSSGADATVSDFHAPVVAISHWIPAWSGLSGKSVRALYCEVLGERIRVKDAIVSRAAEEAGRLGIGGAGGAVIAVHVRGSDKVVEMGDMRPVHAAYHAEIEKQIGVLGKDARVLLLTDWEPAAVEYRARYGSRLIETSATRTTGGVGLHFQKDRDGQRLGEDVLIDTLLASRCDAFVGLAYSNVSLFMSYFASQRGMADTRIALIGPNLHENYNWFLLRRG